MKRKKKSKSKLRLILLSMILLGAAGAWFYYNYVLEDADAQFTSQLTGVEVAKESAEQPILGVMIENSEAARPQTGLANAGIVFEATTEGGITRYLALYQEDLPEEVGPIRSLRSIFVDWLMGFDVSVAHVGGSPDALSLVEQRGAKSLTQFNYPEPYYRAQDRAAPHNMYASTQELLNLQNELDHETSQFEDIPRSDDNPAELPQVPTVTVDFSGPAFLVEWQYQAVDNVYSRFLANQPHFDRVSGEQINIKNVVVLIVDQQNGSIVTTGSGSAFVFKDGEVIEGQWQKQNYDKRIQLIDDNDEEIPLNRGNTWFAALPSDRPFDY